MFSNNIIKIILVSLLFSITVYAKGNIAISNQGLNNIYFLPKQADYVKDKIIYLIKNSKHSINIGMYNFSYKKFAKELIRASKKGVNVKILFDKSKIKKDDKLFKYLRNNGIETIVPKEKLHTKMATFDNNTAVIGSLNWTKESFKKNYEVVLFTKDKKIINDIDGFIRNF
jgi:phosphatidylserine/phosphatidylglycerophosphate/cardiolipin synthase-like enzyme